ncbi:hypothetical protein NS277_04220 [Novosphingobium barchaimii]|nr:hypothetical protein NS277_04220 [Novosphingobium barchaimii]
MDVWGRMLQLKELGYSIHLIATVKAAPSTDELVTVEGVADRVTLVDRVDSAFQAMRLTPHQIAVRNGLMRITLEDSYDFLLIEGAACIPIIDNKSLKCDNVLYRVHNIEHRYFVNLAMSSRSLLSKLYHLVEAARFWRAEKKIFSLMDNLLFISMDELNRFSAEGQNGGYAFLPPALDIVSPLSGDIRPSSGRVLFIGSLFMTNNRTGIEWYMRNVHAQLRDIPSYKLVVAGNTRSISLDWLRNGPYGSEIEIHDSPADLSKLYQSADVFINPMRFGAGMKVKTVEAAMKGLPIVSTSKGLEGTGLVDGVHIMHADEPDHFAEAVRALLNDSDKRQSLSSAAHEFIRREYDTKTKTANILNTLIGESGAVMQVHKANAA